MGLFIFFLVVFFIIVFAVNLASKSKDNDRIHEYIQSRGGVVISLEPSKRSPTYRRHDRLYDIVYKDKRGNIHEALCITGSHKKVYFTDDYIVDQEAVTEEPSVFAAPGNTFAPDNNGPAAMATLPDARLEELEHLREDNERIQAENEQLRAELDMVRSELNRYTGPLMR